MKWVKKFQALSNLCASCSGVLALLATFVLVGSQNAYADLVSAPSEHRMALVIENSDYRGSIPTFPEADGKAVAEKLRSLGVEVELKLDLDKNALQEAVAAFRQKIISARADASTSVTAVFYFSGVGAIPVSSGEDVLVAIPKAGADLFPDSGVPLQWVVDQLGVASQSVLLLDMSRSFFRDGAENQEFSVRSLALPRNMLIAYSSATGELAGINMATKVSYFSESLIRALERRRVPIQQLLPGIASEVMDGTSTPQHPEWRSTLEQDVFLSNQNLKFVREILPNRPR